MTYDKHCLHLSKEEVEANLKAGKPFVIRQNNPTEGKTTFHDEIYGDISVDNSELDDMVLIKSDGFRLTTSQTWWTIIYSRSHTLSAETSTCLPPRSTTVSTMHSAGRFRFMCTARPSRTRSTEAEQAKRSFFLSGSDRSGLRFRGSCQLR